MLSPAELSTWGHICRQWIVSVSVSRCCGESAGRRRPIRRAERLEESRHSPSPHAVVGTTATEVSARRGGRGGRGGEGRGGRLTRISRRAYLGKVGAPCPGGCDLQVEGVWKSSRRGRGSEGGPCSGCEPARGRSPSKECPALNPHVAPSARSPLGRGAVPQCVLHGAAPLLGRLRPAGPSESAPPIGARPRIRWDRGLGRRVPQSGARLKLAGGGGGEQHLGYVWGVGPWHSLHRRPAKRLAHGRPDERDRSNIWRNTGARGSDLGHASLLWIRVWRWGRARRSESRSRPDWPAPPPPPKQLRG